ncbi:MAG: FtsQ-type POTRA domain-containing protein [Ruminococcaceae bacterium]|nr:FtsQ-type POTRA domain-containing protein [Oscillospiraceae bacterium]
MASPTKQKRKRRRAILRRRLMLFTLLLLMILAVLLFTPWFNIRSVEVVGNDQIPTEKIVQLAAIPEGTNMFRISGSRVRRAIMQLPEIEAVRMQRLLPPKIRLTITETYPTMYFPYKSAYVLTNENGKVMSMQTTNDGLDLLYITGVELKDVKVNKNLTVQDTEKFDIIIETLRILQDAELLSEVRSCHFDNLSDCHLYLTDGLKIILGTTDDMEYKASMLKSILPRVNRVEGCYVDLTTPSRAVYGTLPEEPKEEEVPSTEGEDETKTPVTEAKEAESADAETKTNTEEKTKSTQTADTSADAAV